MGLLGALAAGGLGPSGAGCSSGRACPGFDDCTDAKPCPYVRCDCDQDAAVFQPTCGSDGTCFTTMDCKELCALEGSTCTSPPDSCGATTATECACSADGKSTAFAAAWSCEGAAEEANTGDCAEACAHGGGGGSGSAATATVGGFGGDGPATVTNALAAGSGGI